MAAGYCAGGRLCGRSQTGNAPRALAALTRLAEDDSPELLDEIVQLRGVEYATEVVIERQFITVTHSNLQPPSIVFLIRKSVPVRFSLRYLPRIRSASAKTPFAG